MGAKLTGVKLKRSISGQNFVRGTAMTTPASAIKDEVHLLIDVQIETLRQPAPITSSQLHEYHCRSERISTLCQELNRIGTRSVIERRLERAA
jgi:hypothetical protein